MTNSGSAEIAKTGSKEMTKQPRLCQIEILLAWCVQRLDGLDLAGLEGDRLQLLTSEALAAQLKDRGVVKDPVQRTEQGGVLIKILAPKGRILVAGKDMKEFG